MKTYEVRISEVFDAESVEDAVRQMVEFLRTDARTTLYDVRIHEPWDMVSAEDALSNYGESA